MIDRYEVGDSGALLVRPDGHIAWRTTKDARTGVIELFAQLQQKWCPHWRAQAISLSA
ncbi:hypothetical protein [Nocardia sp. NPDC052112]|uniref:aromatic-ring hydroxylase C-terminal domain-containing protein n=1 Tax=Nocardia sp. NPDC052112 TaxID=3155646 RepID=UPI00344129D7